MSFYSERTPIAGKPHQCDGCRQKIDPGERYTYCAGRSEYTGDFWSAHYHSDCREVECTVNCEFGWQPGDTWYPLGEIFANEPEALDDAPQQVRARFGLAAVESSGLEPVA